MTDHARLQRSRPRTFQSREIVWATFESLAHELGMPIDELMNEAMAAYARVRGYAVPEHMPAVQEDRDMLDETHDAPGVSALDRSYAPPSPRGGFDDDDLARTAARDAFARPGQRRGATSDVPESRTTPQRKAVTMPAALSRPVPVAPSSSSSLQPPPARPSRPSRPSHSRAPPPFRGPSGRPPPPPHSAPPGGAQRLHGGAREHSQPVSSGAKQLVLSYQGQHYPVDKDRFLIGRSKTQSDLRLDDPNVSRQHAAIERVGSAWYVVDLGSTNGVHVAGERVARRALSDGDRLVITTHEIRCTLR